MRRTALLLGAALLSSLLAAPPALAAPAVRTAAPAVRTAVPVAKTARPAVKTAVAKVKASPAKQSGACPTTVGFSAVVAAKGRGTVRYRWVRGDGSKGAIKTTQSAFEGTRYGPDGAVSFYRSQNDHLAAELRHWVGACQGKWPPEVSLADARRTIEASVACLKSAQTGQPVALPLAADEPLIAGRETYARLGSV